MSTIDDDYMQTIRSAVREAAGNVGFSHNDGTYFHKGKVIHDYAYEITEMVVERLARHYSHTRKAKKQRKVER